MLVTVYLNLNPAVERREALEQNFRQYASESWRLVRAEAISASDVQSMGIAGTVRPAEKACYLTHLAALQSAQQSPTPLWIREDDTRIGRHTASAIEQMLTALGTEWDILFTDVLLGDPGLMLKMVRTRQANPPSQVDALQLSSIKVFAGAYSYLVNPAFAPQLYESLATDDISTPYDLALRKVVLMPVVRAYVTFPFITTCSEHSTRSAIQPINQRSVHHLWDIFRELMWAETDFGQLDRLIAAFERDGIADPYAVYFGKVMAAMAARSTLLEGQTEPGSSAASAGRLDAKLR